MFSTPQTANRPLIVFSDLDGTLLDHETYSYTAAEPALAALRRHGVPLILASSKTAAEIAPLRARIGFGHCPAIVENGAGTLPPGSATDQQTESDYSRLRSIVDKAPEHLRSQFRGFADLGVAGIAAATGLPQDAARLAAERRFSEPGLWSGTDRDQESFAAWLADHGVHARSGGRFLTLSFGGTKAGQMDAIIAELFADTAPFIVALGDAPNDIEMLERADRGIIIANPHGTSVPHLAAENDATITRTMKAGPAGWNDAIVLLVST